MRISDGGETAQCLFAEGESGGLAAPAGERRECLPRNRTAGGCDGKHLLASLHRATQFHGPVGSVL